jgi:hypothetical protein
MRKRYNIQLAEQMRKPKKKNLFNKHDSSCSGYCSEAEFSNVLMEICEGFTPDILYQISQGYREVASGNSRKWAGSSSTTTSTSRTTS